jgi:hypothetical protein
MLSLTQISIEFDSDWTKEVKMRGWHERRRRGIRKVHAALPSSLSDKVRCMCGT